MQPDLWQLLVVTLAGWVNRFQQDAIEYLKEENRVLREQLGEGHRLRFTDEQRRRLAAKARALGRDGLKEIAELVTPRRVDALVYPPDREEVRREPSPRPRPAARAGNDTRTRGQDGDGEFNLGLYENLRRSPKLGPRRR